MRHRRAGKPGFTLVELLVVIVVIGVLAAIVVPNTIMAGDSARIAATGADLRALGQAVEAYRNRTGRWPADVNQEVLPPEIGDAFTKSDPFAKVVPIGGVYDYEGATSSEGPRIKIRGTHNNPTASDSVILKLDQDIDDGDVHTGRLRESGGTITYFISFSG